MYSRQYSKYYKKMIPSLTSVTFCGTVCVTKGGDTDGEVHIRRHYVW